MNFLLGNLNNNAFKVSEDMEVTLYSKNVQLLKLCKDEAFSDFKTIFGVVSLGSTRKSN